MMQSVRIQIWGLIALACMIALYVPRHRDTIYMQVGENNDGSVLEDNLPIRQKDNRHNIQEPRGQVSKNVSPSVDKEESKTDESRTVNKNISEHTKENARNQDASDQNLQAKDKDTTKEDKRIEEPKQSVQMVSHSESTFTNWTILLTVNNGYYDFFQNWWAFYWNLKLPYNVVVVAEDDAIYSKLKPNPHLTVERSSLTGIEALAYDSKNYKAMVSTRAEHILKFLHAGKDVLYTDIDTVWRSDPSEFIKPEMELMAQVDNPKYNGVSPYYCTGFIAIRSNEFTVQVMERWNNEMKISPQLNQPVFNRVIHGMKTVRQVRHAGLPQHLFPNGRQYFDLMNEEERQKVVVVHNNFIIGHDNKKQRFKGAGLWVLSEDIDKSASEVTSIGPSPIYQKAATNNTISMPTIKNYLKNDTKVTNPSKISWTILITVNDGFYDFFINWWAFYEKLKLPYTVVVVAEDDAIYQKLQPNQRLIVERSSLKHEEGSSYDSANYRKMVSTRAEHILRHLRGGKDVLYTDIDTVWRFDPTKYVKLDQDVMAQVDNSKFNGVSPYYCTGFMSIRNKNSTIELMERWNTELKKTPQLNQPVFNRVIHSMKNIRHESLPRDLFPNGQEYFQLMTEKARQKVVVVHNNYIIGHDKKKLRFQKAGLWNR